MPISLKVVVARTSSLRPNAMSFKVRRKTEWEICTLDEYGDIDKIEHASSKKEAESDFTKKPAPKQLWKIVWEYQQHDCGLTDDGYKVSQDLINEVL
jgi:hypothetical protein